MYHVINTRVTRGSLGGADFFSGVCLHQHDFYWMGPGRNYSWRVHFRSRMGQRLGEDGQPMASCYPLHVEPRRSRNSQRQTILIDYAEAHKANILGGLCYPDAGQQEMAILLAQYW